MNGTGATFALESVSQEFALFRTLSGEQRMKALNAMVRQDLVRGQMLVAQGGPSDSLFLVLHGALAVCRNGNPEPIAELRAGELVGEIGFFANVPRTADVRQDYLLQDLVVRLFLGCAVFLMQHAHVG